LFPASREISIPCPDIIPIGEWKTRRRPRLDTAF
jgi:hypothetical protein